MGEIRHTGKELKRIRISKNIDLASIAGTTRISKLYLEYIEDDNYNLLPPIIYLKAYLEQYAKCLDLDPVEVAGDYLESFICRFNKKTVHDHDMALKKV